MPVQVEMFPEILIALNNEMVDHPKLCEEINPEDTFEERIAKVATYCEVILDGRYDPHEILALAEILYKKLVEKRTSLVLTTQ